MLAAEVEERNAGGVAGVPLDVFAEPCRPSATFRLPSVAADALAVALLDLVPVAFGCHLVSSFGSLLALDQAGWVRPRPRRGSLVNLSAGHALRTARP